MAYSPKDWPTYRDGVICAQSFEGRISEFELFILVGTLMLKLIVFLPNNKITYFLARKT